jgi:hypothetical protein
MGTATDPRFDKYELHYGPDPWIPIGDNPYEGQVTDGELGVWDTTEVNDGSYTLRLRVVRTDGNYDDYTASVEVVNTQPVATAPPPAAEEPTEEAAEPTEEAVEPTAEATEEAAEPTAEAEEPAEEAEAPAMAEGAPEIPFLDMWAGSGHADSEAEAFRHWDEDDPAEVPTDCAACHSTPGYQDYLGADGSEMWVVDEPAPIGTTVECVACHNEAAASLDTIPFPSGMTVTVEGPEARCMVCHQGRASTATVDDAISEAGLEDMDTASEDLGFTNIHYYAAAASLYGTLAQGGYQYEGKAYDAKFDHVEGLDACAQCHDSHTLALKADACSECHTESDPKDVRMAGSLVDYDGDGDMEEGIYYEIETLQEMLYGAIQSYASEVAGTAIVYDAASYPYFFIDTNENGEVDEGEAAFPNAYNAWTGRLAKAAYNYQMSLKDPGAYAHGGKYTIQLLYDSIENLNEAISDPVDLSMARRIDHGHFAGSEEAFRHWDEDGGVVPGSCARCHAAAGLPLYITEGAEISQPASGGLNCATCHNDLQEYTIYEVTDVEFPSGAVIDSGDAATNLCLNCHQGRSSTASVNQAVEGLEPDVVSEDLGFINIHYFAAGATLYGNEVMGAYQYDGKEYAGRFAHVDGYSNCTECHETHMLEVRSEECGTCHAGVEDLAAIRMGGDDYDGDGDTEEGIAGEIEGMAEALYAAMQDYATSTEGVSAIEYNPARYPYFFDDAGERYATWTPTLLKAAYNYQYALKDPGAFAHNADYVLQVLYDGIEDLGGDVSGMTRP